MDFSTSFRMVYTVSPQLFTAFCSRMYLKMGIIPILNAGCSFFWDNAAAYQWLLWPTIIYYPSDLSTDFSRCSYIFPDFSRVFQLFSRFFQVFQLLSTKKSPACGHAEAFSVSPGNSGTSAARSSGESAATASSGEPKGGPQRPRKGGDGKQNVGWE